MASLKLTLSEAEIRLILDHDIVRIVDYDEEPEYDEGRYEVCKRISDCTPGVPFALNVWEAQALDDALAEFHADGLNSSEGYTYFRLIEALDSVGD